MGCSDWLTWLISLPLPIIIMVWNSMHVLIRSEYESKFEIKFLAGISDVMQLILLVYFPGLMEQLHVYWFCQINSPQVTRLVFLHLNRRLSVSCVSLKFYLFSIKSYEPEWRVAWLISMKQSHKTFIALCIDSIICACLSFFLPKPEFKESTIYILAIGGAVGYLIITKCP